MLGAIYIGLSGMKAYSKGLQTISNNVANLNSPGFKATSVSFSDVFSSGGGGLSYLGGNQSRQSGDGVRFGAPRIDFSDGDLRQSEGDLDLAISGAGFLVLLDGDNTFYARTGSFEVADDGYIVMQGTKNRLAVLDATGKPVPVNLEAKRNNPPTKTATVTFSGVLSTTWTNVDPQTVSNIAVYDSRGAKHVWTVTFTPVGALSPDQWTVAVKDALGNAVGQPAVLKFFGSSVETSTEKLTINAAPAGTEPFSVVFDFSKGVSSYSGGNVMNMSATADGNAAGALTNVAVDADGKIKLTYANTKTEFVGAVALADFRDPQKLTRVGSGMFENRVGAAHRLLTSKQDGVGELKSKQLEASNVDLSQEFGDLILVQRGFQASSQVVSVTNDMIQQLFGIRGQG